MSPEQALKNLKIIVTRPAESAAALADPLRDLGADVIEVPVIQFAPPVDLGSLDGAIRSLLDQRYDWVIFTSVTGVRFFFDRARELGITNSQTSKASLAAIGPATANALKEEGQKVHFVPERYVAEEIVGGLGEVSEKRVLLPRADIARKALPKILQERGAIVDEVATYQTIAVMHNESTLASLRESIEAEEIDWLTFTSSSTVSHFYKLLREAKIESDRIKKIKVACIGPIPEVTAREFELNVQVVAGQHDIPGLIAALIEEVGAHD